MENHVPQAVCRFQLMSTICEEGINVDSIVWSKFQRENLNRTWGAKRFCKQNNPHLLILLQTRFLREMMSPACTFDDLVSELSGVRAAGIAGMGSCSQAPTAPQNSKVNARSPLARDRGGISFHLVHDLPINNNSKSTTRHALKFF